MFEINFFFRAIFKQELPASEVLSKNFLCTLVVETNVHEGEKNSIRTQRRPKNGHRSQFFPAMGPLFFLSKPVAISTKSKGRIARFANRLMPINPAAE